MNVHRLPDLCMLEIFDRLPLENLISCAALACSRWYRLVQPSALARREQLKLIITEHDNVELDSINSMRWRIAQNVAERFLTKGFELIRSSFPSLSSLSIQYRSLFWAYTVAELLKLATPGPMLDLIVSVNSRLVKLDFYTDNPTWWNAELCRQINECMPQLCELTLHLHPRHNHETFPIIGNFPIIKQLSRFKMSSKFHSREELETILFKYMQEGCEWLVCCELFQTRIDFEDWLKVGSKVAKKITFIGNEEDIPSLNDYLDVRQLSQMTALFSSLTWLFVEANSNATVVQILANLGNLTQLKLFWLFLDCIYIGEDLASLTQLQLPTVRDIIWQCKLTYHQQLHEWFDFAHLFPRLKTVKIEHRNSDDCSQCIREGKSERDCIQAMCDAFSGGNHPQLKSVQIDGYICEKNNPNFIREIRTEWQL